MAYITKSRGRPVGSLVRQNIVEIINSTGPLHGYDIYKLYCERFPEISLRLVYYHLKKGLETGEFKIAGLVNKEGNFSWGNKSENILYNLGPNAHPIKN